MSWRSDQDASFNILIFIKMRQVIPDSLARQKRHWENRLTITNEKRKLPRIADLYSSRGHKCFLSLPDFHFAEIDR
jgi:hypothetical protein